jgi:hypothetical protein
MKSVPQSDVPQSPFLWSAAIFATLPACRIFRVPSYADGGASPANCIIEPTRPVSHTWVR